MSNINNKIIFEHGDTISAQDFNDLQDNFENWIENHTHTNKRIPILTFLSDTKIEAKIAEEDFLYNFTNQVINEDFSFSEYTPSYVLLKLSKLSSIYNKSILLGDENTVVKALIYSYSSSYFIDGEDYYFVFKTPTLSEEDLDITLDIPTLDSDDDSFTYLSSQYFQKAQNVTIKKSIIKTWTWNSTTSVLVLELDTLENAFLGIPSLPISPTVIIDDSGVTAAEHVANESLHLQTFAPEAGPMETATQSIFSYPNLKKTHPLFSDGKFLITSNDKFLSLNVIKNELNSNSSTIARSQDSPLDGMFRGNSRNVDWLRDTYFSTETRNDAALTKTAIQDDYNYEIIAGENIRSIQSYVQNDLIPSKSNSGSVSELMNNFYGESRAVKITKSSALSTTNGNSVVTFPVVIKLRPNSHLKSYLYTYYYGKKIKNLNKSYLGNFSGHALYYSSRSNFQYNISEGLFYEKILTLGGPYEPFNIGAEHIYTDRVVKDFSNPNANFEGYAFDKVSISKIKQDETRYL